MDYILKTVLVKAGVALTTAFISTALTKAATDAFLNDGLDVPSTDTPTPSLDTK